MRLLLFSIFLTTHHQNPMKIVLLLKGALYVEVVDTHCIAKSVSKMKKYLTENSVSQGECEFFSKDRHSYNSFKCSVVFH